VIWTVSDCESVNAMHFLTDYVGHGNDYVSAYEIIVCELVRREVNSR